MQLVSTFIKNDKALNLNTKWTNAYSMVKLENLLTLLKGEPLELTKPTNNMAVTLLINGAASWQSVYIQCRRQYTPPIQIKKYIIRLQ
jgi:hypothetical protein